MFSEIGIGAAKIFVFRSDPFPILRTSSWCGKVTLYLYPEWQFKIDFAVEIPTLRNKLDRNWRGYHERSFIVIIDLLPASARPPSFLRFFFSSFLAKRGRWKIHFHFMREEKKREKGIMACNYLKIASFLLLLMVLEFFL